MSTLPLTEAILLEIHQSLGCPGYQTTKKNKFAAAQDSLAAHKTMGAEILHAIFDALDMPPAACVATVDAFLEFEHVYKELELHTWTFAADERQILWMLLGYFYIPGLARRVAFWSVPHPIDKGMPGGRFWYLPEPRKVDGKPSLYLPVAHVVDWLLDLLGMPLEEFADERSEATDIGHEGLRRSLYNWRKDTKITPVSIRKYFADGTELNFKGTFTLDDKLSPAEQFKAALAFIERKQLTADRLSREIPMSQPGRLKAILSGHADEDEQAAFVGFLAERYAAPSMRTVRQRLLVARMVQDGYIRLLGFLCPGVDRLCTDAQQNKLLQLFAIYKRVYNLTIEAWDNCKGQGDVAEDAWFEEHLPATEKSGLFLSILPSHRATANRKLARLLTRHFYHTPAGAGLEDHVWLDAETATPLIQRNVERTEAIADEIRAEMRLIERMKTASPWRALQDENRYWVVSQVAQHEGLSPRAKEAAIRRLRELAATPAEAVPAILIELDTYLNGERRQRPKDTRARVEALLDEAEACEGHKLWWAAILQYKAKHLLACNDFESAGKLFREALEAGLERNYGPLRGEIARDCLAVEVANQKLIKNNHEKYYREMLAGGIVKGSEPPAIEDTARWAADYFWNTLYKPYPGAEHLAPMALEHAKESTTLLISGDLEGLHSWMECNRKKLTKALPIVTGDSLLALWIKARTEFLRKLPVVRQMTPAELQGELHKVENMLEGWRQAISMLAQKAPKQLNIADFKGQTPLMLMAEAGDTDLVRIMLQAGADPDMQDWQGMTALHAATKSGVDGCVDVLLDHPCQLDKVTVDGRTPLHTASWVANLHALRRLLQLAPELAWQRDSYDMTPLELTEYLIEVPEALQELNNELLKNGRGATSKAVLDEVVHLLEQAPHVSTA